jgi:hypothetical protein
VPRRDGKEEQVAATAAVAAAAPPWTSLEDIDSLLLGYIAYISTIVIENVIF